MIGWCSFGNGSELMLYFTYIVINIFFREGYMKNLFLALVTMIFFIGAGNTQVSASNSPILINEGCESTYIVQPTDSIARIAEKCGVSVQEIIALNPQIENTNMIYRGQVIRLTASADYSITQFSSLYWLYYYYYNQDAYNQSTYAYLSDYYGGATVTLSTNVADAGDTIKVKVSGFPANVDIDYRVGKSGKSYTNIYDGHTDENGNDKLTITIPGNADDGERWVVYVVTTSTKNAIGVYGPTIYIVGESTDNDDDNVVVELSASKAAPGDTITVSISGFPAKEEIDYKLGKKGKTFKVAYDSKTNSKGKDSIEVTIPGTAVAGETWIVYVTTTNLSSKVSGYSPVITITD
jgi:LysM repeat protein